MKTAELTGAQLDYWVAKAEGFIKTRSEYGDKPLLWDTGGAFFRVDGPVGQLGDERWWPSTNWAHAGPIIERAGLCLLKTAAGWEAGEYPEASGMACSFCGSGQSGPTPLIDAMRAFAASKFGEEVTE